MKEEEEEEEEVPRLAATLQYRVLSEDSFDKPDFFPTFIAKRSSGQKAGLSQSSSRCKLPIHTD